MYFCSSQLQHCNCSLLPDEKKWLCCEIFFLKFPTPFLHKTTSPVACPIASPAHSSACDHSPSDLSGRFFNNPGKYWAWRAREMISDTDFSSINYQYLLKARDVARRDPDLVVALLGIPKELVEPLAQTSPSALAALMQINEPLLTLREESWWWHPSYRPTSSLHFGVRKITLPICPLSLVIE